MPVILPGVGAEVLWIDPATDSLEGVEHLLQPDEWDEFEEYEVASLKGEGPELIARALP